MIRTTQPTKIIEKPKIKGAVINDSFVLFTSRRFFLFDFRLESFDFRCNCNGIFTLFVI